MRRRAFQIPGSREKNIHGDIFLPDKGNQFPVVVYCHGFKGFKDWGCNALLAEYLSNEGLASVFFNFSHNGVRPENFQDITDGEAFGHNNLSTELNDLGKLLEAIEDNLNNDFEQLDKNAIHLLGHSRGGGIALLKAQEDSRIKTVCSLAGVADFEPYTHWIPREQWQEVGVSWVLNSRTNDRYPMYYQFVEDYLEHINRLDLRKNLPLIDKPVLLLHAKDDQVVPVQQANDVHALIKHAILVELDEGGHTFGAKHPWERNDLPPELQQVAEELVEFIKMYDTI